jgi:cytochrome b involved in lipid metabolism
MSKTFTEADVKAHSTPTDLYIVVDGDVYDLTKFQDDHPGGKKILQRVAGKDASKQFWKYHNQSILSQWKSKLQVGSLDTKPRAAEPPKAKATPATKAVHAAETAVARTDDSEPLEAFGDQIPFADPAWYQNVSHILPPRLLSFHSHY